MNEELKGLLEENLKLARENNAMLHKMQRSAKAAQIMRAIYWIFVIGSLIGAYYYLEPFIKVINQSYDQIEQSLDNIKKSNSADLIPPQVLNFFNQFNKDNQTQGTVRE